MVSPTEDPAFLDDHQFFIENAFQNWQVEVEDVFQPQLDGESLAAEINSAIDNLPLHNQVIPSNAHATIHPEFTK